MPQTDTTNAPEQSEHVARASDTLVNIASREHVKDWTVIWKDDNPALKAKRKTPTILYKKDQDSSAAGLASESDKVIVKMERKELPVQVETVNTFTIFLPRLFIRIRVVDGKLKPLAKYTYELRHEGTVLTGDQDKNSRNDPQEGYIKERIPNALGFATLKVTYPVDSPESSDDEESSTTNASVSFHLKIGMLNPILEPAPDDKCVTGVQARLHNLGFHCGSIDGKLGPLTEGAIKRFQQRFHMGTGVAEGEPDPATQTKLQDVHDRKKPIPPPVPPRPGSG